MVEEVREKTKPRVFEVWEENWPTVDLFLMMQTQWVVAGMGDIVGLSYPAAEALIRIYRIKDRPGVMDGLRVMERAALELIRREKKTS